MTSISIDCLSADELDAHADALAEIMAQTVEDGAAIGYMQPFSQADGLAFFTSAMRPKPERAASSSALRKPRGGVCSLARAWSDAIVVAALLPPRGTVILGGLNIGVGSHSNSL